MTVSSNAVITVGPPRYHTFIALHSHSSAFSALIRLCVVCLSLSLRFQRNSRPQELSHADSQILSLLPLVPLVVPYLVFEEPNTLHLLAAHPKALC